MLQSHIDIENGRIEMLYPTPIYCTFVQNLEAIQNEIASQIDNVNFDGTPYAWGKTVDVTDLQGNVISSLKEFEQELHRHLENYCNFLRFDMREYSIKSWFTKSDNGNYTQVHTHHYDDIVGVYYFQTNGNDGDLFFVPPLQLETSYCYQSGAEWWRHAPRKGKLLLFPGWLQHGVKTNETDSTRISLAFSINFKR